jgi:hypothetical protein
MYPHRQAPAFGRVQARKTTCSAADMHSFQWLKTTGLHFVLILHGFWPERMTHSLICFTVRTTVLSRVTSYAPVVQYHANIDHQPTLLPVNHPGPFVTHHPPACLMAGICIDMFIEVDDP